MKESISNTRFFLFLSVLFLLSFGWQQTAQAQVFTGNILLGTQDEVNDFPTTCNCTSITGFLRINGANITDLSPLAGLTSVGGYLYFFSNGSLTNLDGLENLTAVAGPLVMEFNASLTNLDGLANLTSVGERVAISNNPSLTNLDGLANLTTVGEDLSIYSNAALTSIDGLAALTSVSDLYIFNNASLTNLGSLANLTTVGDLFIEDNASLANIDGLAAITSVGGELIILNNPALNSCCDVYDLINGLNGKSVTGAITISGNATGCENIAAINTDADVDGIADCVDNCIGTANPDQADSDGDGIGDVCDACPAISDPGCATCGNGKYLVCHIPAGNPENAQQLCLPLNAANIHIGNHGGCYFGVCSPGLSATGNGNQDNQGNFVVETPGGDAYFLEVAPNPTTGTVSIHLHGHAAGTHLYIRDELGRLVWNQPLGAEESMFNISLEGNRFANGIYYVSILTNGETITQRLVVAK